MFRFQRCFAAIWLFPSFWLWGMPNPTLLHQGRSVDQIITYYTNTNYLIIGHVCIYKFYMYYWNNHYIITLAMFISRINLTNYRLNLTFTKNSFGTVFVESNNVHKRLYYNCFYCKHVEIFYYKFHMFVNKEHGTAALDGCFLRN